MKKIPLFVLLIVSNCFSQWPTAHNNKPSVGYQIVRQLSYSHQIYGVWLFNEGSGIKVYDMGYNGLDGTFTNMLQSDWTTGEFGSAINFDGADAFIDFGSPDVIDDAYPFTIFWKIYDIKCLNKIKMILIYFVQCSNPYIFILNLQFIFIHRKTIEFNINNIRFIQNIDCFGIYFKRKQRNKC